MQKLSTVDYLQHQIAGTLPENAETHFIYPTATSKNIGHQIIEVGEGFARLTLDVTPELHGNQQGTVHGGILCELADAAMGTAQSTLLGEGETFASTDLSIKFFRPVWTSTLTAHAQAIQRGRRVSHFSCEIQSPDGKTVALANCTFLILRGESAKGR